MKKILVATDGSEAAHVAVAWAAELAAATGAKAVAATVIEPPGFLGHRSLDEGGRLLEEEWAAPLAEWRVDHEFAVLEGDPRAELAGFTARGDVDAVVVGTHGAGGFRGLGLGGVAHYLAHHLPCPLIAVPRGGGPLVDGTIVVGADGSSANEEALRWAAHTAAQLGARTVALFVHSPLADVMTHTAESWQYPGEEQVRAAAQRAGAEGAAIEVVLAAGNPVEELVRAGDVHEAGLLVVGRRGWGSLRGLVLGRVSAQLLHHVDRPVAVVPH